MPEHAAENGAPAVSVFVPDHWTTDDVLADQHARYHDQPGNMIYRDECGWECSFWEIGAFLADEGLILGRRLIPPASTPGGAA